MCNEKVQCPHTKKKQTHLRKVIFLTTPPMKSVYLCKNFGVKRFV